jgi:hypothetical protein
MPRLAAALVVALAAAALPATAAASWVRPVPGALAREFDVHGSPYARGRHRGADFAAARGAPVRAACAGRVVVARRVATSGGVVTIACGRWRVSHLPLLRIDVREGARIAAGARIGLAAASREHAGLHLGVRDAGLRFGYVDPLRLLRGPRRPPPAGPPAGTRDRLPRPRAPAAPAPTPAAALASPAAPLASPAAHPLAPWPAWAGLALALAGAAGGGMRLRRSARRRPAAAPSARGQGVR